jgi:siroheme decarboxylase
MTAHTPSLDALDRAIVAATQGGLPLVRRPFAAVAKAVGATEADVIERFEQMQGRGVVRRIAAVPNHYALGLRANGMTVWDVADEAIGRLGPQVGALSFVTHCYRRPRREGWPYNLFAMVHGSAREEVEAKAAAIADLLGAACRAREILYSTRILKKTGFRLSA